MESFLVTKRKYYSDIFCFVLKDSQLLPGHLYRYSGQTLQAIRWRVSTSRRLKISQWMPSTASSTGRAVTVWRRQGSMETATLSTSSGPTSPDNWHPVSHSTQSQNDSSGSYRVTREENFTLLIWPGSVQRMLP